MIAHRDEGALAEAVENLGIVDLQLHLELVDHQMLHEFRTGRHAPAAVDSVDLVDLSKMEQPLHQPRMLGRSRRDLGHICDGDGIGSDLYPGIFGEYEDLIAGLIDSFFH